MRNLSHRPEGRAAWRPTSGLAPPAGGDSSWRGGGSSGTTRGYGARRQRPGRRRGALSHRQDYPGPRSGHPASARRPAAAAVRRSGDGRPRPPRSSASAASPRNVSCWASRVAPSNTSSEPPITCHQAWIWSKTPGSIAWRNSTTASPAHGGRAKIASGSSGMNSVREAESVHRWTNHNASHPGIGGPHLTVEGDFMVASIAIRKPAGV